MSVEIVRTPYISSDANNGGGDTSNPSPPVDQPSLEDIQQARLRHQGELHRLDQELEDRIFGSGFGPYRTYLDDIIAASAAPENQSGEPERSGECLIKPAIDGPTNGANNWTIPSIMNNLLSYEDAMHNNDKYGYTRCRFMTARASDDSSDSSSLTSTSDEEGLDAVTPPNPYQREHGGGTLPCRGQGFQ